MEKIISLLKAHQQKIVLVIAFVLVAVGSFGLARLWSRHPLAPDIRVEEVFSVPDNYNPSVAGTQTSIPIASTSVCAGKIKGSASLIYHVPGGAFYDKTTKPIRCFDTEAEAQAAGFRKAAK
jgi:hypothetical protein